MGSPDFSTPALQALLDAGHRIKCVYAQPPRPANRGQKETLCPVHAFALEKGLEVRTPKSLKDEAAQAEFAALGADAAVVVAYGLILPKPVLEAPRLGALWVRLRPSPPRSQDTSVRPKLEEWTLMGASKWQTDGNLLSRSPKPLCSDSTTSRWKSSTSWTLTLTAFLMLSSSVCFQMNSPTRCRFVSGHAMTEHTGQGRQLTGSDIKLASTASTRRTPRGGWKAEAQPSLKPRTK